MFLCTIALDATHDGQNAAAMSSIYVEVEVKLKHDKLGAVLNLE